MFYQLLYVISILNCALLCCQTLESSYQVDGNEDYSDKQINLHLTQPNQLLNQGGLIEENPIDPWLGLVDHSMGKRAKSGKSRKLRSGAQERSRYRGQMKWKKYPEAPTAGDIAKLLMEIAERRGIPYNNKAIRYGLS